MMFYDLFVKLCSNADKSPSAILEDLGMSKGSLAHWRNGKIPSGETLISLADYFNCTVDYLLGRTDDPHLYVKIAPTEYGDAIVERMDDKEITPEELDVIRRLIERFGQDGKKN